MLCLERLLRIYSAPIVLNQEACRQPLTGGLIDSPVLGQVVFPARAAHKVSAQQMYFAPQR